MKTLILAFLLSPLAQAHIRQMPDLPPDAPSSMYPAQTRLSVTADGLENVVGYGERNLAWLKHINSLRAPNEQLSFTSKDTQRGIPIDKPSEYNVALVQKKLADLRPQIPAEMQKVLFENANFTDTPPIATPDFLNWGRELDRVYQSALRWRMMQSYLGYLGQRRHQDIRGWYFLSKMEDRAQKLAQFASLGADEQAKIRGWLVNMCFNGSFDDDLAGCQQEVDAEIQAKHDLEAYYQARAQHGHDLFQSFFEISPSDARPEIQWIPGAQPKLVAPFQDPSQANVRSFLQDNIQDEWRLGAWHLELPFEQNGADPYVVFRSGVTPHVNRLGGEEITMNSEQPLTEYDAQWTIRHEYGHVLGFPDCYVEFYEAERGVIVNYQFDVDNLMCSRRGHILPTHLAELQHAYQR